MTARRYCTWHCNLYICMHLCVCVCECVCECLCVCVCLCVCMRAIVCYGACSLFTSPAKVHLSTQQRQLEDDGIETHAVSA